MLDISKVDDIKDFLYIIPAAAIVEFITLLLTRNAGQKPFFGVNSLNDWYDQFGIFAVSADVLSLIIGVVGARYIYSFFFNHIMEWSPLYFILIVVLFQIAHDLFFYFAVVKQIPRGHNEMIDIFQEYGKENGAKVVVVDAAMVIGTAVGAMYLKSYPDHISFTVLLLLLYGICYSVFTRPTAPPPPPPPQKKQVAEIDRSFMQESAMGPQGLLIPQSSPAMY